MTFQSHNPATDELKAVGFVGYGGSGGARAVEIGLDPYVDGPLPEITSGGRG